MVCVEVLNNFNKMPIISARWMLSRPIKAALWLVLGISAFNSILAPEMAQGQPVIKKTPALKTEKLQVRAVSNSVVVETIAGQLAQTPTNTTPSTTPNQSTTDTDSP